MDAEDREKLLEEALAAYAAAEPREGLEGRVLARVASESQASFIWHWARLSVATASLILILCFAWVFARHPTPTPAQAVAVPRQIPTPGVLAPSSVIAAQATKMRPALKRHAGAPDVKLIGHPFREPPLSPQERLLVEVASSLQAKKPVQRLLTSNQPVEISALAIQPLAPQPLSN